MSVSIAILGDICPDRGFPDLFSTGSAEKVFNNILPLLQSADYVVANLEAPATESDKKLNKNSVNLKAQPSDIAVLKEAGIRAVALANNHILDYGVAGLEDTLNILNEYGISYYGAGTVESAKKPLIVTINGLRIGFLAFAEQEFNCAVDYGVGANLWDDLDSIVTIRQAKAQCDYLIIQYHGGVEYYIYPSPDLQKRCRAMADAGADFVTCQHSHCIGTREEWNGSEILYGQGNSLFGYSEKLGESWNRGLICKISISLNPRDVSITYIPIEASPEGEILTNAEMAEQVLNDINKASERIKDQPFIKNSWTTFCESQANSYLPMLYGWRTNLIRANRLLKGSLDKLFVRPKQRRNVMNLIRCDAHREVIITLLEEDFSNNNPDYCLRETDEL